MKRALILGLLLAMTFTVPVKAEPQKMKLTCYCPESCSGTITASGAEVRVGICAATRNHLGDCALIYYKHNEELKFLGFYECLDVIGTGSPYVVDVWQPRLSDAKYLMAVTKGDIFVEWVEKPKG